MPRSAWMGESGALDNTQGYSTHLESPSAIQTLIQSCAATNDTFELTGNGIRAITYACYQAYAWKSEGLHESQHSRTGFFIWQTPKAC